MARPEKVRLGEILVGQKLVSEEQLKLALDEQHPSIVERDALHRRRVCSELRARQRRESRKPPQQRQLRHSCLSL